MEKHEPLVLIKNHLYEEKLLDRHGSLLRHRSLRPEKRKPTSTATTACQTSTATHSASPAESAGGYRWRKKIRRVSSPKSPGKSLGWTSSETVHIYLKSGKEEVYHLNNAEEAKILNQKYGQLPPPPPPPPIAPPPPRRDIHS